MGCGDACAYVRFTDNEINDYLQQQKSLKEEKKCNKRTNK